jgi:hypothetical protein
LADFKSFPASVKVHPLMAQLLFSNSTSSLLVNKLIFLIP